MECVHHAARHAPCMGNIGFRQTACKDRGIIGERIAFGAQQNCGGPIGVNRVARGRKFGMLNTAGFAAIGFDEKIKRGTL